MELTDIEIRRTKTSGKTYELYDAGGLYVETSPAGHKWWGFKYRFHGKEKQLSLGVYPEVSLKDARDGGMQSGNLWPMESTRARTQAAEAHASQPVRQQIRGSDTSVVRKGVPRSEPGPCRAGYPPI